MWATQNSRARRRSSIEQHNRTLSIELLSVGQEVRWLASMILEQAVKDLDDKSMYIRVYAREFILSSDFEYWADLIDLDTSAAREALAGRLTAAMREN